ncbi:MAG: hypothetical protein WD904_09260 [Dehalococcoidia bacterium]
MIRTFALATAVLLAAALFALQPSQTSASHGSTPGVVDLVAIDTDPTGNSANGPLGPLDACREVAVGETFTIDVIVDEIDPGDGIEGFEFIIRYSDELELVGYSFEDTIIDSGLGSDVIDFSDLQPLPDRDGTFYVAAGDLGGPLETSVEAGTGVLVHLHVRAPAPGGVYVQLLEPPASQQIKRRVDGEPTGGLLIVARGELLRVWGRSR